MHQSVPPGTKEVKRDALLTPAKTCACPESGATGLTMTSTVPLGRGLFSMIPGTSCLATIVPSLWDKSHSPIEAPRIILALMGEVLETKRVRRDALPTAEFFRLRGK